MIKEPFTDERIGSLLSAVIKAVLNTEATTFKEGCDYRWTINFRVEDEHIVIGKNELIKVFKDSLTDVQFMKMEPW